MYVVTPGTSKNPRQATAPARKPAKGMAEPAPFEIQQPKKRTSFGVRLEPAKPEKTSGPKLTISAGRAILISFALGVAGLLYLAHIFATQQIMRDLTRMQKDYERTRRLYEDRVLTYQRKTGPAEIYLKAKAAGLEYGGLTDQPIIVRED